MSGSKDTNSLAIEITDLGAAPIGILRELTGLPLDSLAHGMIANLYEHPIRITNNGDAAVVEFTIVRAVKRSVIRDFLEGISK